MAHATETSNTFISVRLGNLHGKPDRNINVASLNCHRFLCERKNTPLKKKEKERCLTATINNQGKVWVWIIHKSFVVVFFFLPLPFFVHRGERRVLSCRQTSSTAASHPILSPSLTSAGRQAAIFSSSLRVQQVTQQWLLGTGTNIAREMGWSGLHLSHTLQAQVNSSAKH